MVCPPLIVTESQIDEIMELLGDSLFLRFFLNSIIVASTGTVISTFDSLIAGFVFAKLTVE